VPDEQPRLEASAIEADEVAAEVFRLLSERYPALVPVEELVREFTFPTRPERCTPAIFVDEAVDRLFHEGLVHRIDGFAFASRAGVRAVELWT
jgi:hypothetical protein